MSTRHLVRFLVFSLLLMVTDFLPAQKKQIAIQRIYQPIIIDAELNEELYRITSPATDFYQLQPYNGQPAARPTEAWFFYDQQAIYVGVMLHDHPDSIYNYFTERDNTGMADYFGVYFDPYNQGLVAYGFFVTPAGTQIDIKASKNDGDKEDGNWNAVWESKTRITDKGWVVEMKIPFSALRFSEQAGESWGLNMFRSIRRHNSNNSWSLIDRKLMGFIHQQGELTGIHNVKSPLRLSLSPYLAAYTEPQNQAKSTFIKGGLDLKYGINDAFTLDMMLIPDFGQIQSDDQQLNLSPHEIHYNEKRQFFTEGTELFSRGGIFYSRRIGARPLFGSDVTAAPGQRLSYNPAETQLVNATKISGRTNKGTGLGMLNAMSLEANAVLVNDATGTEQEVMVQPFTNYNVMVVDQALKNNSFVSLINTRVDMAGHPFSANVTATQFEFRNKNLSYALQGDGALSQRGNKGEQEKGYYAHLGVNKTKGVFLWGMEQLLMSDTYNPNDMGYLQHNNNVQTEAWIYYQDITPGKIFREWNADIWLNYNRLYKPSVFTDFATGFDLNTRLLNNMGISVNGDVTTPRYDYYEARIPGRYYLRPLEYEVELAYATDNRRPLSLQLDYEWRAQPFSTMRQHELEAGANWRIGQRMELGYELEMENRTNDHGFTTLLSPDKALFARRNVTTLANTLETIYSFSTTTGLRLRSRHYRSVVRNHEYFLLQPDGSIGNPVNVSTSHDMNYNAFTIDCIFRWIFMPGSELSAAWKSQAYLSDRATGGSYANNLLNAWKNQSHSISLKILYYFDVNSIRN